jgi:hypothetical protein
MSYLSGYENSWLARAATHLDDFKAYHTQAGTFDQEYFDKKSAFFLKYRDLTAPLTKTRTMIASGMFTSSLLYARKNPLVLRLMAKTLSQGSSITKRSALTSTITVSQNKTPSFFTATGNLLSRSAISMSFVKSYL